MTASVHVSHGSRAGRFRASCRARTVELLHIVGAGGRACRDRGVNPRTRGRAHVFGGGPQARKEFLRLARFGSARASVPGRARTCSGARGRRERARSS